MGRGEVTEAIRGLCADFGISERTAWRWLAKLRDPATGFDLDFGCRYCGHELPPEATSRRRYCDDTCRTYARRARLMRQTNYEAAQRHRAAQPGSTPAG